MPGLVAVAGETGIPIQDAFALPAEFTDTVHPFFEGLYSR